MQRGADKEDFWTMTDQKRTETFIPCNLENIVKPIVV